MGCSPVLPGWSNTELKIITERPVVELDSLLIQIPRKASTRQTMSYHQLRGLNGVKLPSAAESGHHGLHHSWPT
jgi:hypothetical protein